MIKIKMLFRLLKLLFYMYILFYLYFKNYALAKRTLAMKGPSGSNTVTLGIIFDQDSDDVQEALKTAMMMYKARKTPVEFQIYIDIINTADVFKLSRLICNQYTRGAVAMLGSVPSDSFDTLHSYSNSFQMPFVTPWFPEKVIPDASTGKDYAVSLRPDYHRAIVDTIIFYGWTDVIYIYDSHDGLLRLQSIYDNMQPGSAPFRIIQVRRIARAEEVIDYLLELEAGDRRSSEKRFAKKYVVLDSSTDIAKETIIQHVRCLKLGRGAYHYLLSGSAMDEHWSEIFYGFENLDITGFRVIDYSKKNVQDFLENWKWKSHISSKAAMMFDSVNLIFEAILRLVRKKPEFLRASARRSIPPNSTKINDCNIEERGITPFEFGAKLAKTIRRTEIDGLTGFIKFDEDGHRSNFTLRIVEMTAGSKSETVGTWYDDKGLTKPNEIGWVVPSELTKTYIIISVQEQPYIMPLVDKRSKKKWKGFSVDLAEMIMKKLGLKYEHRLVKDGKFGEENQEVAGGWDGIIGELIRKEADLSISSLTVSVQREELIEFSRTFLSFETVTEDVPLRLDSIFSFFQPLSKEIWYSIFGSMLAVSFSLYIVSKCSSSEYELCIKPNEDTQSAGVKTVQAKVVNTFTLWNAIWFSLGSFMQQTSGYRPRSLSGRIVSGVWWFLALFVMIIYTANLTTHLTISQLNPPLYTVHQLHKCPAETNKPCDMMISIMETGLKDFAVAFPKGSPLREGVNLALLKLRNDGDLYRLIRKWFLPLSCSNQHHGKEMSLSQIAGLFYILLGGLGLGLIIGFIEYISYRRKNKRQPINASPPGTPVRTPNSPVMRSIMKPSTHRSQNERDAIDWNAANYAVYGSPSNHECQDETSTHGTFRQV